MMRLRVGGERSMKPANTSKRPRVSELWPRRCNRHAAVLLGAMLTVMLLGAGAAHAQITTDGSLGSAGALTGPNYTINSTLGQINGNNLFHSFGVFNVNTGESATFNGPGN